MVSKYHLLLFFLIAKHRTSYTAGITANIVQVVATLPPHPPTPLLRCSIKRYVLEGKVCTEDLPPILADWRRDELIRFFSIF